MARFTVTFRGLRQDSRDYGSDEKFMVSRVFFSLEKDGKGLGDFCADLKQAFGTDMEKDEIEVTRPIGYDGPFNQDEFSIAATEYFREVIVSKGPGVIAMARRHIRMRDNYFVRIREFSF